MAWWRSPELHPHGDHHAPSLLCSGVSAIQTIFAARACDSLPGFSSTPFFFFSRSHLSCSCFLVSQRGFVDFHPVPPRINLVPPSPFPASPLQGCHCALSSHPCTLSSAAHSTFLTRGDQFWRCGRVSRGRWQPSLGQGWGGSSFLILLEKPFTSQA